MSILVEKVCGWWEFFIEGGWFFILSILIILGLLSLPFIKPHFEAKNYYRITGIQVGYWDAFFCSLDPGEHVILLKNKRETK